jgi:hypothetical protein
VTHRRKAWAGATTAARPQPSGWSTTSANGVPLRLSHSSMQAGLNAAARRADSRERTI